MSFSRVLLWPGPNSGHSIEVLGCWHLASVHGKTQPERQKRERRQQCFTPSALLTTDIKMHSDIFFTSMHRTTLGTNIPHTKIQDIYYISYIVNILTFDSSHVFEWEEGIKCQNQKWAHRSILQNCNSLQGTTLILLLHWCPSHTMQIQWLFSN